MKSLIVFAIVTGLVLALSVTTNDTVVQAVADQYTSLRGDCVGVVIEDSVDICPYDYNPDQIDSDLDSVGDSCDNCPFAFNPDQADSSGNGIGDICDVDCGNVNNDDRVCDVDDLTWYLGWLFEDGPPPPVLMSANTGGCLGINVHDLVWMITYMWGGYPLRCEHQLECDPIVDSSAISLDHVDGLLSNDTIPTGHVITFHLRVANLSDYRPKGLTNGFRVYSPTGAGWDTTVIEEVYDLSQHLDLTVGTRTFSVTGSGADTVGFYGVALAQQGLPIGFDSVTHMITVGPIDRSFSGGEICLDSCWFPPGGDWLWAKQQGGMGNIFIDFPAWDGPHCFPILYCCDIRADVDRNGAIDVGDLTYLVAYLFQGGPVPPCPEESDVDGSGSIDVGDLMYLVAYLFLGGPAPPPC
ncbi:MAG: dockerin type I domain-containing protein [bacterium]